LVLAWLVFMYYRFVDGWLTSLSALGQGLVAIVVVVALWVFFFFLRRRTNGSETTPFVDPPAIERAEADEGDRKSPASVSLVFTETTWDALPQPALSLPLPVDAPVGDAPVDESISWRWSLTSPSVGDEEEQRSWQFSVNAMSDDDSDNDADASEGSPPWDLASERPLSTVDVLVEPSDDGGSSSYRFSFDPDDNDDGVAVDVEAVHSTL
jgi:hypothetical protein